MPPCFIYGVMRRHIRFSASTAGKPAAPPEVYVHRQFASCTVNHYFVNVQGLLYSQGHTEQFFFPMITALVISLSYFPYPFNSAKNYFTQFIMRLLWINHAP
jgi:hypothetical protein